MPTSVELTILVVTTVMTVCIAAGAMIRPRSDETLKAVKHPSRISMLFDGGVLPDADAVALKRFTLMPDTHVWTDLRERLVSGFPDFPAAIGADASGRLNMLSTDAENPATLEINWQGDLCWVDIFDGQVNVATPIITTRDHAALERCCATLTHPVWETDGDGNLGWYNTAYATLVDRFDTGQRDVPFSLPTHDGPRRVALTGKAGPEEWFEITSHRIQGRIVHHAVAIDTLVKAEEAQRNFVQTLAKTFAHLPVGLAIFDRSGQLGIFNPALVDLTGLQPSFLAGRPNIHSFFDTLRENRRMPEPKNYKNWRQDIAEVIAAASGAQYRETWTLEDGRTYAVQGRPHPDGATAFLIEDISAEVTLSRSYRAEIGQFEGVLDYVTDALAVFSSAGILTFCNAAYRQMWCQNPDTAFADVTIHDAVHLWGSRTQVGTSWQIVTDFVATIGTRTARQIELRLPDGQAMLCQLSALAGDATLVQFLPVAPAAKNLKNRSICGSRQSLTQDISIPDMIGQD